MGSRHDFDFLMGTWSVHHHRLVSPLDPTCTEWVEFNSVATAHPILDGLGNADDTSGTLPDGGRLQRAQSAPVRPEPGHLAHLVGLHQPTRGARPTR